MSIANLRHIHFVGIKGVGMTSLALCALDLGMQVTGSDIEEVFVTDEVLKKRGITWSIRFSQNNLEPRPDLVITTGAHGGFNNPEVIAAKIAGVPVMSHAEALAEFARGKDIIAVCGVGGKTTTSSMIATILDRAGKKPSFAIGVGNIPSLGTPGRYSNEGKEFICEADEFVVSPGIDNRPRFSLLSPKVLVVTNIEHDHPDVYPTLEDTKRTFRKFFEQVPKDGILIACIDNQNVQEVIKNLKVPLATYGANHDAQWKVGDIKFRETETQFSLLHSDRGLTLRLQIPGRFNVLNSTAAFIAARFLGVEESDAAGGLHNFLGSQRRFEKVGEVNRVLVYDDYAHHPTEIISILRATREWFPKRRIIAVFQPHTYSRTKALFNEFAQSFKEADIIALMDIYASLRETDTLGVNSQLLAKETQKYHKNTFYTKGHKEAIEFLLKNAKSEDVILTLGAGNIFYIHKDLLEGLLNL